MPRDEAAYPPLPPPDDARVESMGSSSTGNSYTSSATVQTRASLSDVLGHYRKLLVDDGWEVTEELRGREIAVMALAKRDKQGQSWRAQLAATAAQPGSIEMAIHATQR